VSELNPQSQARHMPPAAQGQVTVPSTQSGQTVYVQVTPEPKGASITSMVLGLVSIVMGFTFFLPLIGLICAFVGLAREPAGRAYAVVGLLLNGFFIGLWLIFGSIIFTLFGGFGLGSMTG